MDTKENVKIEKKEQNKRNFLFFLCVTHKVITCAIHIRNCSKVIEKYIRCKHHLFSQRDGKIMSEFSSRV